MQRIALLCAGLALCSLYVEAQGSIRERWSTPTDPYHVIGPIYYVGATGISSHILVTTEGLILIDTGTVEMVPQIVANIEKLGHRIEDVKYILSSHAHWDHVEGHAEIKRLSGAKILAMEGDADSIERGVDTSALGSLGWTPVKIARTLKDGDTFVLGNVKMKAYHTPGHTKGCTAWTTTVNEDGKGYKVVFIGGTSINGGVKLLNNARHRRIDEDYARTFRVLKKLEPDVFLAQHPSMYKMSEKRDLKLGGSEENPFIDPHGYRRFVAGEERKYLRQLEQEYAREN